MEVKKKSLKEKGEQKKQELKRLQIEVSQLLQNQGDHIISQISELVEEEDNGDDDEESCDFESS